jgi:hypothetical protein
MSDSQSFVFPIADILILAAVLIRAPLRSSADRIPLVPPSSFSLSSVVEARSIESLCILRHVVCQPLLYREGELLNFPDTANYRAAIE